jgi:hypothetical protein
MKKISVFVGAMLVLGWTASSDAELVFTIEQVGSNVVATGSGNADLAALTVIPTIDHAPPTS